MSAADRPGAAVTDASGQTQYAGLITQIMTTTLDADYETVSRTRAPHAAGDKPRRHVGLVAVLATFGLMLGVSAVKTEQDAGTADRERAALVDQIHTRQDTLDGLHGKLTTLQDDTTSLQVRLADDVNSDQALSDELSDLGVASGGLAVTGPGIAITVDDAEADGGSGGKILDTDLQALVNALWQAGAEAVAIDEHRLTSLTAIRFAGEAITVDYRSLTPPYVITATGDGDTLPARLLETKGGQIWLGLRANFGIRFDTDAKEKLTVPADPHEHLLYARTEGEAR